MSIDFESLKADLLASARTIVPQWLPGGKFQGREYVCGNLSGGQGESCKVNCNTGKWNDFASGDRGGNDLISLYAAIHDIGQADAARELGAPETPYRTLAAVQPKLPAEPKRVTEKPPKGSTCDCVHSKFGTPLAIWAYRDGDGDLLGYAARHDPPGMRKQIIPWTYADSRWGMGQFNDPRPLYGLEMLAKRKVAPVMVVEGEKAAEAARQITNAYVVVTWPAGGKAWHLVDWTPLAGRKVLLWPDADAPGAAAMDGIGDLLLDIASEVKRLTPHGQTDGWDAADALAEGWDYARWFKWAVSRIAKWEKSNRSINRPPAVPAAAAGPEPGVRATGTDGRVADLAAEREKRHKPAPVPQNPSKLPTIQYVQGERARMVGDLARALAPHNLYFRRESALVRVIRLAEDESVPRHGIKRNKGAALLREPDAHMVVSDASSCALVIKETAKEWVKVDLPSDVAQSFRSLGVEQTALPILRGIALCPLMREDGSLFTGRGYDADSQMYLAGAEDWSKLDVPEHPTVEDAKFALEWITEEIYGDFPFDNDVSRAAAISALFTAVMRPTLDKAPLHAFSAPSYGAGKSLLADIAHIVATGLRASMMAAGESPEEFAKRVDAAILAGSPINVIDNMSVPLTGDGVCIAMTSERAIVRVFGSLENKEVPTTSFWMVTGQNLSISKDMVRRCVISYIDPHIEEGERREFSKPDIDEWVMQNRVAVLSKVYTVLRAHALAGLPSVDKGAKLDSFLQWSKRIVDCLTWLGMKNPKVSQAMMRDDDPHLERNRDILNALLDWQVSREICECGEYWTVQDVNEALKLLSGGSGDDAIRALRSQIEIHCRGDFDAFAKWLRSNKGTMCDRKYLYKPDRGNKSKKSAQWTVRVAKDES